MPSLYPAETRYYFQHPNTGRACFLYYSFAQARARLLVVPDEDMLLSAPTDVEDRALARALTAGYFLNQRELEQELRERQIDWTADNR